MKILLLIICILVLVIIALEVVNVLSFGPDPNTLIYKKEIANSWLPFLSYYYLYDRNNVRFKVDKKIYESYKVSPFDENIYATDAVVKKVMEGMEFIKKKEEEKRKKEEAEWEAGREKREAEFEKGEEEYWHQIGGTGDSPDKRLKEKYNELMKKEKR